MPFRVGFVRHESALQAGDVHPRIDRSGVLAKMARSQVAKSGGSDQRRKGRFSSAQIVAILRAHEQGTTVPDICRQHGISPTTFYKWRSKFAGAYGEASPEKNRIAELEEESRRLKELLGETVLENSILKELLAKKGK
jgi:putative transposase